MMKSDSMRKLRILFSHTHPKEVPSLLVSLQRIGMNTNTVKALLRAHRNYKEGLRLQMANVPHCVEEKVRELPIPEGVNMLKENVAGLELQEALWMYEYFKRGIIPWFSE
jgi:hypothetical protein